jgi:hypothetical protein
LVPLIRNERGGYSQQCSTGPGRQSPKISVPTLGGRRYRRAIFLISYSLCDSQFELLDKRRRIIVRAASPPPAATVTSAGLSGRQRPA